MPDQESFIWPEDDQCSGHFFNNRKEDLPVKTDNALSSEDNVSLKYENTSPEETLLTDSSIFTPDQIIDDIRLTMVDGIGPRLFQRLLDHFQTLPNILAASTSDLYEVPGIGSKLASKIVTARDNPADDLIALCQRENIKIISRKDSRYPSQLLTITDPPILLYQLGETLPADAFSVSVVGTRGCSPYGRKVTARLVSELVSAGFVIISGLARGIDGVAHRAALDCKGRTIAVLGSGLMNIFPSEHLGLAREITQHGAVFSEFHPLCPPRAGNFPQRNRIVSALSLGTIVIESPLKGGALVTARLAMEQNKDVFAVPGPIDQENSKGCNRLLKDGAHLVESADDVINALGPLMKPIQTNAAPAPIHVPAELNLNEIEKQLLLYISDSPVSIDTILEKSNLPAQQVLGTLSALEFRRIVRRLEGNKIQRI